MVAVGLAAPPGAVAQVSGPYAGAVLATAGLEGYWRLGETSGTVAAALAVLVLAVPPPSIALARWLIEPGATAVVAGTLDRGLLLHATPDPARESVRRRAARVRPPGRRGRACS